MKMPEQHKIGTLSLCKINQILLEIAVHIPVSVYRNSLMAEGQRNHLHQRNCRTVVAVSAHLHDPRPQLRMLTEQALVWEPRRTLNALIRAVADAKEKYGLPPVERKFFTSFPDGK